MVLRKVKIQVCELVFQLDVLKVAMKGKNWAVLKDVFVVALSVEGMVEQMANRKVALKVRQ